MKYPLRRQLHLRAISFLLLFSCRDHGRIPPVELVNDQITIIIQNGPQNNRIVTPMGTMGRSEWEIAYLRDDLIRVEYVTNKYPINDTLIIHTKRNYFEVLHKYEGLEIVGFIFKPGDSVILTYKKGFPHAEITNRLVSGYDVNYEGLKKTTLLSGKTSRGVKAHFLYFLPSNKNHNSGIAEYNSELHRENLFLDSLLKYRAISKELHDYFLAKSYGEYLNFMQDLSPSSSYTKVNSVGDQTRSPADPEEYVKKNGGNDSLSYFKYHLDMIDAYLRQRKVQSGKPKTSGKMFYWDERIVYDSLAMSKLFEGKTRKQVLFGEINLILKSFPASDLRTYFNKFKSDVHDSVLVSYMRSRYHLDNEASNELNLKMATGDQTNLNALINKSRGKMVYIDIWASWCSPCIESFPLMKKLEEEYKDHDVLFVYLSIDEQPDKWNSMTRKLEIDESRSYLITNRYSSRLLENIQFQSIPRYLLFNKNGMLINDNATGPNEIRAVFDKNLPKK